MSVSISRIARTPPMGWNSFDSYGIYLNEADALSNMAVMAERLRPHGYEYFVIDMGWYAEFPTPPGQKYPMTGATPRLCVDPFGRYTPSPVLFPHGLGFLADHAHQVGLKFGLHIMRGIPRLAVQRDLPVFGAAQTARAIANSNSTCRWNDFNYGVAANRPGAQEYYNSVVALLAGWGVDFVKADDIVGFPEEIELLANAIESQDRPIALSLSPGNELNFRHLSSFRRANMVRLTRDVWDRPQCIDRCFDAWNLFNFVGASGFWPDLDMIPFGHLRLCLPPGNVTPGAPLPGEGIERWCQWLPSQQRTFLTMLALASSPLFMGGDLLSCPDEIISMLTNRHVVDCNQQGMVGRKIVEREGVEVWKSGRRDDSPGGWLGIFNRRPEDQRIVLSSSDIGTPSELIKAKDVWTGEDLLIGEDPIEVHIGAGDVLFLALGEWRR